MRNVLLGFLILIIHSCKVNQEPKNVLDIVKDCDQVDIEFHNYYGFEYTVPIETYTKTEPVHIFESLINGSNDVVDSTCKISGKLLYKKKDKIILIAFLSMVNDNLYNENCNYIKYSIGATTYTSKLMGEQLSLFSNILNSIRHPKYPEGDSK